MKIKSGAKYRCLVDVLYFQETEKIKAGDIVTALYTTTHQVCILVSNSVDVRMPFISFLACFEEVEI